MFGDAAQQLINQKQNNKNADRHNAQLQDKAMIAHDNLRA